MQGVEILTSRQIATEWATDYTAFWIAAIVIFVISLAIGIFKYAVTGDVAEIVGYSCIGVLFGYMGGVLFGVGFLATPTDYETRYQVTISDEVSMNDFYEHYEVIDQDGKIFTVKEKTNEEHQ